MTHNMYIYILIAGVRILYDPGTATDSDPKTD